VWDPTVSSTITKNGNYVTSWQASFGAAGNDTKWVITPSGGTEAYVIAGNLIAGVPKTGLYLFGTSIVMPGTVVPACGNTGFLAYRDANSPAAWPSPIAKCNMAENLANRFILERKAGNDRVWVGNTEVTMGPSAAMGFDYLRVAMWQIHPNGPTEQSKFRLTHPTTITHANVPAFENNPLHEWALAGYRVGQYNQYPNTGTSLCIHEIRVYDALLSDAQISAVTTELMGRWQ
jgi:hypothetical protein